MNWGKNSFITETNITIIVIKIWRREGDKTKEQVMHNTTVHHLLTNDQPVPEPQSPPAPAITILLPPVYILSMMFYGMEHHFGQFGHLS